MGITVLHYNVIVLVLIMLACNFSMCSSGDTKVSCIEKEREALFAFKQSLANSTSLSDWTGQDCCSWSAVSCNDTTGHVTELYLRDVGLIGGEVSPSLAELKHLENLDLATNDFLGSKIPSFFGNFESLISLDLSESSFAGVVPHSLGNLSTLQSLRLSGLKKLKIDDLNWLSQLSTLQTLDLSSVDLSQVSDISPVLNSFPSLTYLSLKDCKVNDFRLSSVSYANLTSVGKLDLSVNHFSGPLPDWLSQLPNIQSLDLSNNLFSGLIPWSLFGNSSHLTHLSLRKNFLSGLVSEAHFENLANLTWLDMGSNSLAMNVSTDWVPPFQLHYLNLGSWIFGNGFPRWLQTQEDISYVFFPNVKFSGSNHFEDLLQFLPSSLVLLDLSNCSISGSIPPHILSVMPYLQGLRLRHNNIGGRIPTSLCETSGLFLLDLAYNHLSGYLPHSCWNETYLMVLDLSSNSLTGLIPSAIGNWSSLISLHLRNNNFFGKLPQGIGRCKTLRILDLANNGFSGNLPAWIKRLEHLQILNLRSNKFAGSLVHELCDLSILQILDLAHNKFIKTIPSCFGNFSRMIVGGSYEMILPEFVTDGDDICFDSLTQVMKGKELEYTKILKLLVSLDLSSNNLEGHIPEELTLLSGLNIFNLSYNRLTGLIPEKIGNFKLLESLDFSHNHLTGMIPQSLSELTYLVFLNLSYNNLSGKIPTGNQLQTLLDPSIYEGNQGLCGIPIEKKCVEDGPFQSIDDSGKANKGFEKFWFYMGLVEGIVVGFWGFCGVLFFKRTWRYTYFHFVENVYDMITIKFKTYIYAVKKKFDQTS